MSKMPAETQAAALTRLRAGHLVRHIASDLGVSASAIYQLARRTGVDFTRERRASDESESPAVLRGGRWVTHRAVRVWEPGA